MHNSVVCTPMSGACTADVTFVNHYPLNGEQGAEQPPDDLTWKLLLHLSRSQLRQQAANSVGNVSWIVIQHLPTWRQWEMRLRWTCLRMVSVDMHSGGLVHLDGEPLGRRDRARRALMLGSFLSS